MGYTHYWRRKRSLATGWGGFLADVKKVHARLPDYTNTAGGFYSGYPLKIAGGDGTGKPIFNSTRVVFNGGGKPGQDLEHETFFLEKTLSKKEITDRFTTEKPVGYYFNFCKTARKPYDLFVTAVLLLAKQHFKTRILVSSDGDYEDWEEAYNLLVRTRTFAPSPRDALERD